MSLDPMKSIDDITNLDISSHTVGNKGRPISEYEFTTSEGESATITTCARNPECDESNALHVNFVYEIDGLTGFNNTHVPVDDQDME